MTTCNWHVTLTDQEMFLVSDILKHKKNEVGRSLRQTREQEHDPTREFVLQHSFDTLKSIIQKLHQNPEIMSTYMPPQ